MPRQSLRLGGISIYGARPFAALRAGSSARHAAGLTSLAVVGVLPDGGVGPVSGLSSGLGNRSGSTSDPEGPGAASTAPPGPARSSGPRDTTRRLIYPVSTQAHL